MLKNLAASAGFCWKHSSGNLSHYARRLSALRLPGGLVHAPGLLCSVLTEPRPPSQLCPGVKHLKELSQSLHNKQVTSDYQSGHSQCHKQQELSRRKLAKFLPYIIMKHNQMPLCHYGLRWFLSGPEPCVISTTFSSEFMVELALHRRKASTWHPVCCAQHYCRWCMCFSQSSHGLETLLHTSLWEG